MKVKGVLSDIIFGPVQSRRYGVSLGVNLLPPQRKVCSFNCVYCECGHTERIDDFGLTIDECFSQCPAAQPSSEIVKPTPNESSIVNRQSSIRIPQSSIRIPQSSIVNRQSSIHSPQFPSPEEVISALSEVLERFQAEGRELDAITLAGNGEPTLHPQFAEIMRGLAQTRDRWAARARLVALSNATTLGETRIREALMIADERILKLDAANDELLQKINAPLILITVERLIEHIRLLPACITQTMFIRGKVDNTTDEHVEQWIEAIGRIRPAGAQVYSIDRVPADPEVLAVAPEKLQEIASQLMQYAGVPAWVY
ncbi:MAG: hypothetical protein NTX50_03285 [Candidatus Sumerlaeota bacterium]|nr:hypothetical protein [Candidatus Sumerlaeota bacterium]